MRYRREQHIKRTAEFTAVRTQGKRRDCGAFFVFILIPPTQDGEGLKRVGVVASKRMGNAVERNRAKRLMREIFRLEMEALPASCALVFTARRTLLKADLETCRRRFRAALKTVVNATPPSHPLGESTEDLHA